MKNHAKSSRTKLGFGNFISTVEMVPEYRQMSDTKWAFLRCTATFSHPDKTEEVMRIMIYANVRTLKDGYIRNVPLPRVPRIQSASLATLAPSRCIMVGHEPSRCIMVGHAPAITYYSQVPQVPTWSDLTRSLSGFDRRTLLPFFPVRLM